MAKKKKTSNLEEALSHYLSPKEAAEKIGVTRSRVAQLISDDRIVGVVHLRGLTFIPEDFEILPSKIRRREGKISTYMDDWDRSHGREKEKKPEIEEDAWKSEVDDPDDLFI